MRLSQRFMGFVSVLILCGAVGVLHPANSAAANFFKDKFVTNKELKDLILMLKEQVGNSPKSAPCAVPPTWSEVIPGDKRFVPTTFVDPAKNKPSAFCDRETGLVWETVPSTDTFVWGDISSASPPSAQRHCINRIVGTNGQKGWRLPSIAELASLVDTTSTSCTEDSKCMPDGSPFETGPLAPYWSASELAGKPTDAWIVDFGDGKVLSETKHETFLVWCVRGATDADVN
jgi:hypothetical protein